MPNDNNVTRSVPKKLVLGEMKPCFVGNSTHKIALSKAPIRLVVDGDKCSHCPRRNLSEADVHSQMVGPTVRDMRMKTLRHDDLKPVVGQTNAIDDMKPSTGAKKPFLPDSTSISPTSLFTSEQNDHKQKEEEPISTKPTGICSEFDNLSNQHIANRVTTEAKVRA